MAVTTVEYDNFVKEIRTDVGITLAAGTYTKGQIVTSVDGVTYDGSDIILSTIAGYNTQTIYVLSKDQVTADDGTAAIGYTGEFNSNVVTLPGVQTIAQVGGILQAKDITLKDWSK